jgi:IS30 family transposase
VCERSPAGWIGSRQRSRGSCRNASTRTWRLEYKASIAQWHAERRARRPKVAKLATNDRLREYVQDRLSGVVRAADGCVAGPPGPKWKGKNKPHRGDRRWVQGWSPEQIAQRLKVEFPDDESMRISHEAIYQALYVQGRGALKRELVACLRTGRALRVPRARARQKAWAHVTPEVMISERPAEVEDRAVPGHWEGDLLIGLKRSAIGTLVERTTRFTMLIHLPREEGFGVVPRTKNGPALAGYGAVTMKNALASAMSSLPQQLRQSLTWDRGKELSAHVAFKVETGIPVFFADPYSPWQRGTNENTKGLLRQYFPKGTDLSRWSAEEIEAVAATLNSRPRKTLDWKTPAETFDEYLESAHQGGCDDRLSLVNTRPLPTPTTSPTSALHPRPAPSATASIMRWPRRSSGCSRPSYTATPPLSPATAGTGAGSMTSRSPPADGCHGSTKSASTASSTTAPRPRSSRPTTVTSLRPPRPEKPTDRAPGKPRLLQVAVCACACTALAGAVPHPAIAVGCACG